MPGLRASTYKSCSITILQRPTTASLAFHFVMLLLHTNYFRTLCRPRVGHRTRCVVVFDGEQIISGAPKNQMKHFRGHKNHRKTRWRSTKPQNTTEKPDDGLQNHKTPQKTRWDTFGATKNQMKTTENQMKHFWRHKKPDENHRKPYENHRKPNENHKNHMKTTENQMKN